MNFEDAIRLTEILVGFAFLQQSLEHALGANHARVLFGLRVLLSVVLILGFHAAWACVALFVLSLLILGRFQGPYNGGSDRLGLLILCSLCLQYFMPTMLLKEAVFGYMALQVILSYFIAGWVKIMNADWRHGQALRDVFLFSAYPVSEKTRDWSARPRVVFIMSWSVMLFELLFPIAFITQPMLLVGLTIAACFHLANTYLFGLNRFFWIWLASYPSLLWLQQRLFA